MSPTPCLPASLVHEVRATGRALDGGDGEDLDDEALLQPTIVARLALHQDGRERLVRHRAVGHRVGLAWKRKIGSRNAGMKY